MLFPPDQTGYLTRGARTTIRVPVDRRLTRAPLRATRPGEARPFVPALGELLPIAHPTRRPDPAGGTKHGWETVCRVQITEISLGPLGRLTDQQAINEGYPTAEDFEIAWTERHDRDWYRRQIDTLTQEGVDPDDAVETVGIMAVNRFPDRWAAREAWTLTVQVEHDIDLHMERTATAKSEHGYTVGADQVDGGPVAVVELLNPRWQRKAIRRQLEAVSEHASPAERARRARFLSRRVRELALQDPKLASEIERLVRAAEQQAA